MHCNLHDQHGRTEHSVWWTRGLDCLHEPFRPSTFRLLPAEIADRVGCWQGACGFWGIPRLSCISSLGYASTALAQHTLKIVPK
jgi:hypothetical protein